MKIKYVVQDPKTGLYLRRIFVVPRDAKIPQPKENYLEVTWVRSLDDASHIVSQMGAIKACTEYPHCVSFAIACEVRRATAEDLTNA